MQIDDALISSLLYEEESNSFDVKSEQYKFSGATDEHKSELLKDILAFANSWRKSEGYILIGAKEEKGGRNIVHGVDVYLDDSDVQEFVNGKTQRTLHFSLLNFEFEDKKLSLIKIPVQKRPIYLKKDYGKLKKETVYIRRGSSTAIATPEEIADMGRADISPGTMPINVPHLNLRVLLPEINGEDCLFVQCYQDADPVKALAQARECLISEESIALVLRYKKILEQIIGRRPDGQKYYPFQTQEFQKYTEKAKEIVALIQEDFEAFCSRYNIYSRSFEMSYSKASELRKKSNRFPSYCKIEVENQGSCPAKNVIIYLKKNPKIQILDFDGMLSLSIELDEVPEDIKEMIQVARGIQSGVKKPYITEYEKVHGHEYNDPFGLASSFYNPFEHLGRKRLTYLKNGNLAIELDKDLMHNHSESLRCTGFYLCPMLREGEEVRFEYEIHAENMPIPCKSFVKLCGKSFT